MKKRKKLLILSLLFVSVNVFGLSYINSSQETYDNSESGLKATNVQEALDELYERANTCPEGYTCEKVEEQ